MRLLLALTLFFMGVASFGHPAPAGPQFASLPGSGQARYPSERLDALVERLEQTHLGIEVRDLESGERLYGWNAEKLFCPASVQKALTSLAILDLLGSTYRFRTVVFGDRPPEKGIMRGNIYLKGYGDPSLSGADLTAIARRLREGGLSRVDGDLILDDSYFRDTPYPDGWMHEDLNWGFAAPISALSIDGNAIASASDTVAVLDPVGQAGARFLQALGEAGVRVKGRARRGVAPVDRLRRLHTHWSKPLGELLEHMNKESDNHYAETFVEHLGAGIDGIVGSRAQGLEAIAGFLYDAGVATGSFRVTDGSGLSRYNALSPSQIGRALVHAQALPDFRSFYDSLAIAGVDGTLKSRRMPEGAVLHAKTGTMSGVSSLAGYLSLANGRRVSVVILMNGFARSTRSGRELQDLLITELASALSDP